MQSSFFDDFEEYLEYSLPDQIKTILIENGFDNDISLSQLNEDFISILEGTVSNVFKFLPGHRVLLLGLSKRVEGYREWKKENKTTSIDLLNSQNVSFIFKELMKTASNNCNVEAKRRRYSDAIKNFGIYLYIMCGKQAYEVISNNLPFPHPGTILQSISMQKENVIEGKLRVKELSDYLTRMNAPRNIWLSEDGSGIIPKACYDSGSNQIVGLVLPISNEDGQPISYTYTPGPEFWETSL